MIVTYFCELYPSLLLKLLIDINIKTNFLASLIIHIGHMGTSGCDVIEKKLVVSPSV